ncbi:hypothetical protein PCE1_003990 [Barthelona sp. PCE]
MDSKTSKMKVGIVCCSLSLNTKRALEYVANEIGGEVHVCLNFAEIEKRGFEHYEPMIQQLNECDILGVGSLAWAATIPLFFEEALNSMPFDSLNKPYYLIAAHAGGPGRVCAHIHRLFRSYGNERCAGWINVKGPNNMPANLRKYRFDRVQWNFPPKNLMSYPEQVIKNLEEENWVVPPYRAILKLVQWARRPGVMRMLSANVSMDHDKCIGCNKCVDVCIVGSLVKNDDPDNKVPIYVADTCIGCQCCVNVCPVDAFEHNNRVRWDYWRKDALVQLTDVDDEQIYTGPL